jgi:hypothetical protein
MRLESETKRNFRFSMSGALPPWGEGYGSIVVREAGVEYYKTLKKSGGRLCDKGVGRGVYGWWWICGLEGIEWLRSFVAKALLRMTILQLWEVFGDELARLTRG